MSSVWQGLPGFTRKSKQIYGQSIINGTNGHITSIEPRPAHDELLSSDVHEDLAAPVLAFPHTPQCDHDIQQMLTTDSQEQ